jgi:hypothetical protein
MLHRLMEVLSLRKTVGKRVRLSGRRRAFALAFIALAPCASAWASLGQGVTSVEDDSARLQGSLAITVTPSHTVHEIQLPTGTVVREFVAPGGAVFAVSWHGPFVPNLRQLLGSYFPALAEAAQARRPRGPGHRGLLVRTPEFVVEAGGHMRAFFGRAYIPELVPGDMDPSQLR